MAGRIVRQGRLLAALIFAAAMLAPAASHAQEIVLPPASTASATADMVATTPDNKYAQCTSDADCVLLDDSCKSATVVNQLYIADANAGVLQDPACRTATPTPDGVKATCRNGLCGLLPGKIP